MSSLQRGENWVRSASRNSRARASALDPTTQSKLPHCYFQFRPYEINADNQGFTVREVVPRISGRMSIPYQSSCVQRRNWELILKSETFLGTGTSLLVSYKQFLKELPNFDIFHFSNSNSFILATYRL